MKYHFLNGKTAETKEFKTDEEAAAAAQKDKSIIRVQNDKTLKYVHEAVKAVTALILACLFIGLTASAATVIGVIGTPGVVGYAVNSTSGGTNTVTQPTNGLYTASITNGTESNIVLLNPGAPNTDQDTVIQLTAQANAATTSNAVFVISSSALPITITNSASTGAAQSANPRGTFTTYTLVLNGTTAVTTNIVLSHYSTPAVGRGLNLYLESIQNTSLTALLTNYSVAVVP
jgi:hypothetical protein